MGPRFVTLLFGPLGDALMALALFDDLVQVAPNATLTILTRRNAAMIRELAKNYPGITVLEVPEGVASLRVFAHILSHRSVVLMLGLGSAFSWRYRLLFLLLRLRGSKTVGFWLSGLSVRIPYDISLSMLDNFRRLMPHALPGWEVTEGAPSVQLPQREPKAAPKPGSYIVMHVAGASIAAALPPARWQTLISYINHQYPHLAVVLTGTPTERSKLEALGANLQVVVRTDLSISELVWLIDNAALYVGIDTGVTHIAGVLQQKSIVVRHCSDPSWMPTYNPHARVLLNSRQCNPEDPTHCLLVEEGVHAYRRCTYDISDAALARSVDLAVSMPARSIPLFSGVVDEARR
jgi:ADP-heptose:LPS heptosyltransferase